MRTLVSLSCAALLAVAVTACGSSGGSDGSSATTTTAATSTTSGSGSGGGSKAVAGITADDYAAAFVSNLSAGDPDQGQLVLTKEQAACVGPKFVKAITVETLHGHDVTVAQVSDPSFDGTSLGLTAKQGEELVAAFEPCGVDIVDLFIGSLTSGMTDEQQACSKEKVDRDQALDYLSGGFADGGDTAKLSALQDALTKACDLPGAGTTTEKTTTTGG
ncbi:hypothetical protein [Aquihabitans sp. McL0605]|uniref:hypothetical protein n=1 Tax=Aquihabitans sp. McL0605 TaxID=3415671 RepID=UPI003CEA9FDB